MRTGVRVAVDVGAVRIGVAACDAAVTLSFGVETVPRGAGDVARLVEVAHEREAIEVIVGLPIRLDGSSGPAAEAATTFAMLLAAAVDPIPVRAVDERLTTAAAQRGLHEAGRTVKSSRSVIDEQAAVQLLEDALQRERSTGEPAGAPISPGRPVGEADA